jgi:hypothetical protein
MVGTITVTTTAGTTKGLQHGNRRDNKSKDNNRRDNNSRENNNYMI